jgi:hypothetical protein
VIKVPECDTARVRPSVSVSLDQMGRHMAARLMRNRFEVAAVALGRDGVLEGSCLWQFAAVY